NTKMSCKMAVPVLNAPELYCKIYNDPYTHTIPPLYPFVNLHHSIRDRDAAWTIFVQTGRTWSLAKDGR
ncbi:MAG: hypothetical protein MJE68_22165, partial [Proteobacteria bacterium]|nr:hypothetical protein [Pseudomonadota bacterium]